MVDTGDTERKARLQRCSNRFTRKNTDIRTLYGTEVVSRFLAREQNPGAERLPDKKGFKSCRNNDGLNMAFALDKFRREVGGF